MVAEAELAEVVEAVRVSPGAAAELQHVRGVFRRRVEEQRGVDAGDRVGVAGMFSDRSMLARSLCEWVMSVCACACACACVSTND